MGHLDVAAVALVVVGYALLSERSRGWPLTMPMVLVGAGVLCHVTGLVELTISTSGIEVVGEVALAVVLFADAVRIDVHALRRERGIPLRLLGIGLPLTLVVGAVVVLLLLPGLGVWQAALLAAVLAPTDAALGQAVVEDPSVPTRVRQSLNVESGLNDGLVLPVVLLLVALSGGGEGGQRSWSVFALQQIGLGALVGVVLGGAGVAVLRRASRAGWVDGLYAQLATLAVAVLALTAALAVGGNGYVSAFSAGLAFGAFSRGTGAHLAEYTEDSGQLLAALSFFLFGNVLVPAGLSRPTWQVVICAVLLLTVARMVPVWLSLAGSGAAGPTRLFAGWFGPRGLASIVFGLLLLEERVPAAEEMFSVVVLTVLLSVAAHGATAAAGTRRYVRWWETSGRDRPAGCEAGGMREHPVRGARRPFRHRRGGR